MVYHTITTTITVPITASASYRYAHQLRTSTCQTILLFFMYSSRSSNWQPGSPRWTASFGWRCAVSRCIQEVLYFYQRLQSEGWLPWYCFMNWMISSQIENLKHSDEVLEAMALASRRLAPRGASRTLEVLGLGLGLGPQVLDNWLPHNNYTFCNLQWNRIRELEQKTFAITLLLIWIKFKFY